jgi:thiol-disulfide isomerase/thioredoxin
MRRPARLAASIAGLLWALSSYAAEPRQIDMYPASRMLPTASFIDGEGQRLDITSFRGQAVVLHFFATWCLPCRDEVPALQRLQQQFPDHAVQVVMVSLDSGGPLAVQRFFKSMHVRHLDAYFDPGGDLARAMGIKGLPSSIIVGPDGREAGRVNGAADWDAPPVTAMLAAVADQRGDNVSAVANGSR